jgi:N-acyl homoserine lactone hydrolase
MLYKQEGTVSIKELQRHGKGIGAARQLITMTSRAWTEPLPIFAWVIEHPEGIIVIDTGETANTANKNYFTWWQPYFKLAVREQVKPEDEIDIQLKKLGISTNDVRWVIMTHLHTDHAGGIAHFPKSEFIISQVEYHNARGFKGKMAGYLPQHWPSWFNPTLIAHNHRAYHSFESSHTVTKQWDIVIVPTPGHTAGHQSVILKTSECDFFFAGDTSYTEDLMRQKAIDGITTNMNAASSTIDNIHQYIQGNPSVYLPSHDPQSVQRLENKQVTRL